MPQITGTLINPDLSPVSGVVNIQLKSNTAYLTSVAIKTILSYRLDNTGSFSANLVPGTYEVTLPNLSKIVVILDALDLDIKDYL